MNTPEYSAKEQTIPQVEDFSHITGDIEDFIFYFSDNKLHSEK